MAKYLFYPFAVTGDRAPIPEPGQGDGSVSWQQGFTVDYELVYPINPSAKPVPRSQSNQYLYDISNGIKQYQEYGFNDFITNADNQGTDFPYEVFSICRYDSGSGFNLYQSMETANDTLPVDTTKWRLLSGGLIPISATASVTDDQINQEFEVDVTAGDVVLTLPPAANWIDGDTITFRIVAADANEDNKMQILGDGAELISSYNDHDFYFVGSWLTVKKISTGLIISDYCDNKSILFQAYFNGSAQNVSSGDVIVYPDIDPLITNFGTFYNTANGQFTLKIRGDYSLHSSAISTGGPINISTSLDYQLNGSTTIKNSRDRRQWTNTTPSADTTANFRSVTITNYLTTVIGIDFPITVGGTQMGFSANLLKRLI